MDAEIVRLEGPKNYQQWYDYLYAHFYIEDEWKYLTKIIDWSEAGKDPVRVFKTRGKIYNFILNSISDDFLLGLIAHEPLDQQNEPSNLMALVDKYCECTPATAASLITKLTEAEIESFPNVAVFVSYFQLAKICLEPDSEVITVLLHHALREGRPDIYQEYKHYAALDWDNIVGDLLIDE
ncbi:hypothetical protein EsH8_X_000451 [Colletotrichum jinshuiense]